MSAVPASAGSWGFEIFRDHGVVSSLCRRRLRGQAGEQLRELGRREDVVDWDTLYSASRHAGVERIIRVLHHRHAASTLHRHQSGHAVIECAGEQDRDDPGTERPSR